PQILLGGQNHVPREEIEPVGGWTHWNVLGATGMPYVFSVSYVENRAGLHDVVGRDRAFALGAPPSRRLAGRRLAAPRRRDGAGPAGGTPALLHLLYIASRASEPLFSAYPAPDRNQPIVVPAPC